MPIEMGTGRAPTLSVLQAPPCLSTTPDSHALLHERLHLIHTQFLHNKKATHGKGVAFSIPEQMRRAVSYGLAFTSRSYRLDRRGPPRLTTINKQQDDQRDLCDLVDNSNRTETKPVEEEIQHEGCSSKDN